MFRCSINHELCEDLPVTFNDCLKLPSVKGKHSHHVVDSNHILNINHYFPQRSQP